ncbi:hypothetical protein KA005_31335, partial [bacterium]|nr:hypothetical protein [bacterium]
GLVVIASKDMAGLTFGIWDQFSHKGIQTASKSNFTLYFMGLTFFTCVTSSIIFLSNFSAKFILFTFCVFASITARLLSFKNDPTTLFSGSGFLIFWNSIFDNTNRLLFITIKLD